MAEGGMGLPANLLRSDECCVEVHGKLNWQWTVKHLRALWVGLLMILAWCLCLSWAEGS